MPYPLLFLDTVSDATGLHALSATYPLTVGSSFQTNDLRVIYVIGFTSSVATISSFPGWTKRYQTTVIGGNWTIAIFTQTLTPSSVDGVLTFSQGVAAGMLSFTVRNPNLAQTWAPSSASASAVSASTVPAPSVSVTAGGAVVTFSMLLVGAAVATTLSPASGMTQIGYSSDLTTGFAAVLAAGETFLSSGTSGTLSAPFSPPAASNATWAATSLFLAQNPDVTVAMTASPNETDAGVVATSSIPNTQTHFTMSTSPNEIDAAPQVFTQLTGFRISPPLAIPQSPITNSVIHWDQATPAVGSTVTVETSVDGGLTWQPAFNDQPVARLLPGTSVWQTVQTRVTLTRLHVTDPTPSVSNLEVRVATNASNAELVSLGLFSINNTNITVTGGTTGGSSGSGGGGNGVTGSGGGNTGGGLSIEISGVDLSRSVSRNSWEDVYFVDSGTNYADAIHDIIEDRLPNTQYNFASTTHTTPKLIFGMSMDSDPWQDAQDLATAIGMELFFDAQGVCTLRDVPDPGTGQPVWTFSDSANPTIASATRSLTDQTVFNYIVAYGESVDNAVPVSAVAFDDNPNSPTYYLGAYGKVPTSFLAGDHHR
jgi:hypothetical protein